MNLNRMTNRLKKLNVRFKRYGLGVVCDGDSWSNGRVYPLNGPNHWLIQVQVKAQGFKVKEDHDNIYKEKTYFQYTEEEYRSFCKALLNHLLIKQVMTA